MNPKSMKKGFRYQVYYKVPSLRTRKMLCGTFLGRIQPRIRETLVFDLTPVEGSVEIPLDWVIEVSWTSRETKPYNTKVA